MIVFNECTSMPTIFIESRALFYSTYSPRQYWSRGLNELRLRREKRRRPTRRQRREERETPRERGGSERDGSERESCTHEQWKLNARARAARSTILDSAQQPLCSWRVISKSTQTGVARGAHLAPPHSTRVRCIGLSAGAHHELSSRVGQNYRASLGQSTI